ncbi:MAG: hypothetical protein K8T89_25535 [Planctomycetes bacterium]|nr:hypothetical protein [Planctomycetota bacterium]
MNRLFSFTVIACLVSSSARGADPDIDAILKNENRRVAWERLVERGPKALPNLLDSMNTKDTAAANWLRTAFDRIVDRDIAAGGKGIDIVVLQKYIDDTTKSGRARRLALDLLESLKPGTRDTLVAGWINDPEFRFDAVAEIVKKAEKLPAEQAKIELQKAFAAARDIEQSKAIAGKLDKLGVQVSVIKHLGFVLDWHVIGPFDGLNQKGFATPYPPEEKVDLAATLQGKTGMVTWKRLTLKEANASAGGRLGLMNLLPTLGTHHDAVAYAYTVIHVGKAIETEFRGSADDNLSVWVNGKRAFGFEEYRNGVRHDRHRFPVKFNAGENTILVKIVQVPFDVASPEANWEFLLRIVDREGKGLAFTFVNPTR